MKILFSIIVWIKVFLFWLSSIYAGEYYMTWWGWGTQECLNSISWSVQNYNFGNTYHWWISESDIKAALNLHFFSRCWLYSLWADTSSLTGILIPIYQPRMWVSGFYEIYTWSYITSTTLFYLSNVMNSDPIKWWKLIAGFYGGIFSFWKEKKSMNNEAYLASLNPPFSNAYITQWYSYFGRPLLVARDSSWLVTDVFIQNPLNNKNQKEVAKKYLWDKWYHP